MVDANTLAAEVAAHIPGAYVVKCDRHGPRVRIGNRYLCRIDRHCSVTRPGPKGDSFFVPTGLSANEIAAYVTKAS